MRLSIISGTFTISGKLKEADKIENTVNLLCEELDTTPAIEDTFENEYSIMCGYDIESYTVEDVKHFYKLVK